MYFEIFSFFCSFETSDRTVFDDSALNYLDNTTSSSNNSNNNNRGICTDTQSGGTSCLHLKSEPLCGPSSPESTSELLTGPEDCAGCGRLIQVKKCHVEIVKDGDYVDNLKSLTEIYVFVTNFILTNILTIFTQDRFYLSAVEKRWHAGCLQCCVCRHVLDGETSCFSRDGNIYCKSDYYRYVAYTEIYIHLIFIRKNKKFDKANYMYRP